jgi:UDP-galactopyranose mutase
MVSFALNESTRYISPTKTPEYLAGGKPVISTRIKDVVETYGKNGMVHIIDNSNEFVKVAELELAKTNKKQWLQRVDEFLTEDSWDFTVKQMRELIYSAIAEKQVLRKKPTETIQPHYNIMVKGSLPAAS